VAPRRSKLSLAQQCYDEAIKHFEIAERLHGVWAILNGDLDGEAVEKSASPRRRGRPRNVDSEPPSPRRKRGGK
jgi:hypothetical protein